MNVASWDRRATGIRGLVVLLVSAMLAAMSAIGLSASAPGSSTAAQLRVIVRSAPGMVAETADLVARLGGVVGIPLQIINGFAASVPQDSLSVVSEHPSTVSVSLDEAVEVAGKPTKPDGGTGGGSSCVGGLLYFDGSDYCAADDPSSMALLADSITLKDAWKSGYTGDGIDIGIIDTGVTAVEGLLLGNRLVYGPDLSFDAGVPGMTNVDGYGHGTHLAGIAAGRDSAVLPGRELNDRWAHFIGAAPDAKIVSVKVGDRNGVADVSQVIAALDWVVQHKQAGDLNIRVLLLAFSSPSTQDPSIDPLAFAAEVAWKHGLVVVTAAGNHGKGGEGLPIPASNPFVLAVGATDNQGTKDVGDDIIPTWSQVGTPAREPDVVAPGNSIPSLIPPESVAALGSPGSLVGNGRLLRGSGTSQAAAVVAGSVAVLLEARPSATPDQIKAVLRATADPVPGIGSSQQGQGIINVDAAVNLRRWPTALAAAQTWLPALGTGSLEAARGGVHVVSPEGDVLEGEVTVLGSSWTGSSWTGSSWTGSSWTGSSWTGSSWTTGSWLGSSWTGSSWTGSSWTGSSWTGSSWTGSSWTGSSWSGSSWS